MNPFRARPTGPSEPTKPSEPSGPTEPARSGTPVAPDEPVPPPRPGAPVGRPRWDVIAVVALGGALGSAGRYGLLVLWPHTPDGFPWATLGTNLSGCALIGLLMRLVSSQSAPHRLVQPFFVTGMLGGFTTFSTYAVETRSLLAADRPGLALGYLLGTLAGALAAVRLGVWAADRVRS